MGIVDKALEKLRQAQQPAEAHPQATGSALRRSSALAKSRKEPSLVPVQRIVIDQDKLMSAGVRPPLHEAWQIAEQYRQIKRPLIANASGRGITPVANRHVIMVASAMPGEGKTFTAVNLAYSIASEKDVNVLLIDADVPKPQLTKLFALTGSAGLLDALQDEPVDVESLILATDTPGLSLLPVGRRQANATELLASERMRTLVTRLGEHDPQRIVLLDSPPLLLTTESRALAAVAGQVVLVVCAGQTAQQTLLDALNHLEGCTVALVMNQNTNLERTGYYYGNEQPRPPA
jgi:protein-tyrosine kinase